MVPELSRVELWREYRSLTLGRPVNIAQAYSAVYPWIECDGIYYSKYLEIPLTLMKNGIYLDLYKDQYDMIMYIQEEFKKGAIRYSNLAIMRPNIKKNNMVRLSLLKNHKEIAICGRLKFSTTSWNTTVYTDDYTRGGNYLPTEECLLLSDKMPIVCDPYVFEDYNVMPEWNNIWIWED